MLESLARASASGVPLLWGVLGLGSIAALAGGAGNVLWLAFGFVYFTSMLTEVLRINL